MFHSPLKCVSSTLLIAISLPLIYPQHYLYLTPLIYPHSPYLSLSPREQLVQVILSLSSEIRVDSPLRETYEPKCQKSAIRAFIWLDSLSKKIFRVLNVICGRPRRSSQVPWLHSFGIWVRFSNGWNNPSNVIKIFHNIVDHFSWISCKSILEKFTFKKFYLYLIRREWTNGGIFYHENTEYATEINHCRITY